MSSRFVKLLILFLLIALISVVFLLNPQPVTFSYGFGKAGTAPLALVLIVTFCAGLFLAGAFSFVFGIALTFRHWRERKGFEQLKIHLDQLVRAREYAACGRLDLAEDAFRRIVDQDPTRLAARIMLAETLLQQKKKTEALSVLDQVRAHEKKNIELLLLCSRINGELGNVVAAYDNLALALPLQPENAVILQELVRHANKLGQLEKAIEYQRQLVKISDQASYDRQQDALAQLELDLALKSRDEKKGEIESVLRRHREYAPALAALAEIEKSSGNPDAASKLWMRAFKAGPAAEHLISVAKLWLGADEPSRAISSVKAALASVPAAKANISSSLTLVSLLMHLEMRDEARAQLEKIMAAHEGEDLPFDEKLDIAFLRWKLAWREGRASESETAQGLMQVLEEKIKVASDALFGPFSTRPKTKEGKDLLSAEPPSPRLSTP